MTKESEPPIVFKLYYPKLYSLIPNDEKYKEVIKKIMKEHKKNIAVVGEEGSNVTLFGKLKEVGQLEVTDPRNFVSNVKNIEETKSLEDINKERLMKHLHEEAEKLIVESQYPVPPLGYEVPVDSLVHSQPHIDSLVGDLSNVRGMGNGISFFELIIKIKVKYHGTTLPRHTKKKHPRYLIVDESYIVTSCTDIDAYVDEFKFLNPHLEVVGVTTPLVDYLSKSFDKFKEK